MPTLMESVVNTVVESHASRLPRDLLLAGRSARRDYEYGNTAAEEVAEHQIQDQLWLLNVHTLN